jgi:hypothetical protein
MVAPVRRQLQARPVNGTSVLDKVTPFAILPGSFFDYMKGLLRLFLLRGSHLCPYLPL